MNKPPSMTIADVLDMRRPPEEGEVIGSIAGKIKKVWEYKTGRGDHGDWSFQNIELVDGRDTIKVVLKDREELDNRQWSGAQVIIESTEGSKGWNGVKAKDDTYKGKTTRIAWVTGSADIREDRGGAPAPRNDDRQDSRRDDRDARPARDTREPAHEERREERRDDRRTATKQPWRPLGVTVGMALNNACSILIAEAQPFDPIRVHQIASDLLWVSKKLEMGQLSPFSKAAAREPAPAREERQERREEPPPPKAPAAAPPEESDDVPF